MGRPRARLLVSRTLAGVGLGLILVTSPIARAADPSERAPAPLERLLAGSKRATTLAEIPPAFAQALRAEYDASKAIQAETPFDPFLASRYFRTMESIALRSGKYSIPKSTASGPSLPPAVHMCIDGACDDVVNGLDPTVWAGDYFDPTAVGWTPGITPNNGSIPNVAGITPCPPLRVPGQFDNVPQCASHASQAHHSIVPNGFDPVVSMLPTVAPTPSANPASLRLGNRCTGFGAERVARTFLVPPFPPKLQFWYAMVVQHPEPPFPPHVATDTPGFGATLVQYPSGVTIPGRVDLDPTTTAVEEFVHAVSTNSFFSGLSHLCEGPILYRPWTCVTIDLSGLENTVVSLVLENRDCMMGRHWGYTYLDSFCMGCEGNPPGDVAFDPPASSCGKGKLCFDVTVPHDAFGATGQVNLSVQLYQNGLPVGVPLPSGPITVSGPYCFSSFLGTLDTTLAGYDWSLNASFTLAGNALPSITIGVPNDGQIAGYDNDCELLNPCDVVWGTGVPDPCCGYHMQLSNAGGAVKSLSFSVTSAGATVLAFTSASACPHTTPGTPATSGTMTFTPACATPVPLDIAAATTAPNGWVTITLTAVVMQGNKEVTCSKSIRFKCCAASGAPCDTITWEPKECPDQIDWRHFKIVNMKLPQSNICRVDIAFYDASNTLMPSPPLTTTGYHVRVDNNLSPPSWGGGNSNSYQFMQLAASGTPHGLQAVNLLEFMLGVDETEGWSGWVQLTVTHCDGTTCIRKFPWAPASSGVNPKWLRSTAGNAVEGLRAYRVEFSRERVSSRAIRWIGVECSEEVESIVAITGAALSLPIKGSFDNGFANVRVAGRAAMIELRPRQHDADPAVTVVYLARNPKNPRVQLHFYDRSANEVATSVFVAESSPVAQPDRPPVIPKEPPVVPKDPPVRPKDPPLPPREPPVRPRDPPLIPKDPPAPPKEPRGDPAPNPTPVPSPVPDPVPASAVRLRLEGSGMQPIDGTFGRIDVVIEGQAGRSTMRFVPGGAVSVGSKSERVDDVAEIRLQWEGVGPMRRPTGTLVRKDGSMARFPANDQTITSIDVIEVATSAGARVTYGWAVGRPSRRPQELTVIRFVAGGGR